jgi:hypothetical protein
MILSARFLDNYVDVNTFDYTTVLSITTSYPPIPGQTVRLVLQLVDVSKDKSVAGFFPAGRRYVWTSGSAKLEVLLASINQATSCSYVATNDSEDKSIWYVDIPEVDLGKLRKGTWTVLGNLRLTTDSSNNMLRFSAPNAINILSQNDFN